jgi:hypothetical protein
MANETLYGTDVQALFDLPDPEVLCSGDLNVAHALSRRLANDSDAMEEIGDNDEYDAINLNDWLGGDFDLTNRTVTDDLQQQAQQVLLKDPRVLTVVVQATYTNGALSVKVTGQGADGPFSFVLPIPLVTAPLLSVQP